MVKVRMNTADVAAEVKCLKRLIGMRCSNVYDISPKVPISQYPKITPFVDLVSIRASFDFGQIDCRRICSSS